MSQPSPALASAARHHTTTTPAMKVEDNMLDLSQTSTLVGHDTEEGAMTVVAKDEPVDLVMIPSDEHCTAPPAAFDGLYRDTLRIPASKSECAVGPDDDPEFRGGYRIIRWGINSRVRHTPASLHIHCLTCYLGAPIMARATNI